MNTQHPAPEEPATPEGAGAGHQSEPGAGPGTNPTQPLPRPGTGQAGGQPSGQPGGEPSGGPGSGQSAGTGPLPFAQPAAPAPPPQDFFGWVRSRGIERGSNRWVGGVSSGVAARLGIDPVIVRGIFIVLALFAGIGVLLYGLCWAFLPEPDGRIHVQEAAAGRWTGGMTGSLITTLLGFGGLGGGYWGGERGLGGFLWACFWLGVVVLVVYLLVDRGRRRTAAADFAGGPSGTTSYGAPDYAAEVPYSAPYPAPYAAPYVASGGAPYQGPYGEDSHGPGSSGTHAQPPAARPKPRAAGPGAPAVAITAGIALLAGGSLKLLDAANIINLGGSPNAVVWAVAAAILGLGIVLAGSRGRTSGILGFFAVIALLVGAAFNVAHNSSRLAFDDVSWNPASIQEATEGISVTGARGTVDLTDLDLDAPLGSDVVVPLDITASNLTVIIPGDVPVEISADMTMGNIQERGSDRGGISTRESIYNSGLPGAPLVVDIDGTFSNVTIQEGN